MFTPLDVDAIRADFPILSRKVHGVPLVYLDNAATTQKPQAVIDAITEYYTSTNANIHRGVHLLSQRLDHLLRATIDSGHQAILLLNRRGYSMGW